MSSTESTIVAGVVSTALVCLVLGIWAWRDRIRDRERDAALLHRAVSWSEAHGLSYRDTASPSSGQSTATPAGGVVTGDWNGHDVELTYHLVDGGDAGFVPQKQTSLVVHLDRLPPALSIRQRWLPIAPRTGLTGDDVFDRRFTVTPPLSAEHLPPGLRTLVLGWRRFGATGAELEVVTIGHGFVRAHRDGWLTGDDASHFITALIAAVRADDTATANT